MNYNYGKSGSSPKDFNFDIGIGSSNRPRSLNDQKTQTSYSSYSYSSSSSSSSSSSFSQHNKPSWTHEPAPAHPSRASLNGPSSMVGDIFGRSWGSSSGSGSGVGITEKNPNLFGDLVNSALGQGGKGINGNVPLKDAKPATWGTKNTTPYSMGNLANSLPKTSNSPQSSGLWGSQDVNFSTSGKSSNLGGPSMRSMGGGGGNKDPFGSLVDFGSKPKPGGLNSGSKGSEANVTGDAFGDFQNASKSGATSFSSGGVGGFGTDGFGTPSQNKGGDPLDSLFSGGQQFGEVDDLGLDSGAGVGGNDATTELEGLPPPPAGVTASVAMNKGVDNKNQGQYAEAIKWLSWAVVLLEKSADKASTIEALSCRASCYKEVGEYKKAVADCSKVLEQDEANVSVLVQRALLYESMEKYKLGAEDLRTVMKIDPSNRLARSTIHRLTKMVD